MAAAAAAWAARTESLAKIRWRPRRAWRDGGGFGMERDESARRGGGRGAEVVAAGDAPGGWDGLDGDKVWLVFLLRWDKVWMDLVVL